MPRPCGSARAKRLDQLGDNLAAVELKLTQNEIQQLDLVSALPPEYPGWMLPFKEPIDKIRPKLDSGDHPPLTKPTDGQERMP